MNIHTTQLTQTCSIGEHRTYCQKSVWIPAWITQSRTSWGVWPHPCQAAGNCQPLLSLSLKPLTLVLQHHCYLHQEVTVGEVGGIVVLRPYVRHIHGNSLPSIESPCSVLCMEAGGAIWSALQVLRWQPPCHHLPLPLAKWQHWIHEAANGQCFPGGFALRWHNSHFLGDLTPPGYWVDPDEIWIPHSSEVKAMGSSQGGSIFQLKNPREMCSKLILSESCGNEFVQRRERFSNQECVNNWPRHDQVSLK